MKTPETKLLERAAQKMECMFRYGGWFGAEQLLMDIRAHLAQPQVKMEPLTDVEITSMFDSAGIQVDDIDFLYRVIGMVERAHGIEAKGTEA